MSLRGPQPHHHQDAEARPSSSPCGGGPSGTFVLDPLRTHCWLAPLSTLTSRLLGYIWWPNATNSRPVAIPYPMSFPAYLWESLIFPLASNSAKGDGWLAFPPVTPSFSPELISAVIDWTHSVFPALFRKLSFSPHRTMRCLGDASKKNQRICSDLPRFQAVILLFIPICFFWFPNYVFFWSLHVFLILDPCAASVGCSKGSSIPATGFEWGPSLVVAK